jgi:outer membrane protein assembly factor BamC
VDDGFDRAWRRVGLALDRTGFTVEDRDRSAGTYFVRYVEPNADRKSGGFFSKLFSKDEAANPVKYRISVKAQNNDKTVVSVLDSKGAPETSPVAQKIVTLLQQDLK